MIDRIVKMTTWPLREVGKAYLKRMLFDEYRLQRYEPNERCIEYRFVFDLLLRLSPRRVLDVGTGKTSLPHLMRTCGLHVTAVDNIYDYWSGLGMFNRHYYIFNDDITQTTLKERFDVITCISTLEHIAEYDRAMKNMAGLLGAEGHIILTCPYNDVNFAEDVYKLPGSSVVSDPGYICRSFSRKNLANWCLENGLEVLEQEYWQCYSGDFWAQGEQVNPPRKVSARERHQFVCVLMRKREKPL